MKFAVTAAVAVTMSVLSYLLSSRVRALVQRVLHFGFDTTIQVELTRVDRYGAAPERNLDMDLFEDISELSDAITFDAIDHDRNILRVRGDELPTPLEIRIEPMPIVENGTPEVEGHEVRVSTYTDMTFGYRNNSSLKEFQTLSDDIAELIQEQCFDDRSPNRTFLTGKVKGTLPTDDKKIKDDDIQMRAQVKDDEVKMTFSDPRYLTRGIQKYFEPL